jgi:hypothetical protein
VTLPEQIRADLDAAYSLDEFAESVTLNGTPVTALIGVPDETSEQQPAVSNVGLTVSLRVSEVPTITGGDRLVVRGVTYRVLGYPQHDSYEWSLELEREMVTL